MPACLAAGPTSDAPSSRKRSRRATLPGAILKAEPDADDYVRALAEADSSQMSQGTLVELSAVLWRQFRATETDVRALLTEYDIAIEGVATTPLGVPEAHP